jgi:hypothetical protein
MVAVNHHESEQALDVLADLVGTTSFDELLPEPVQVSFVEFVDEPVGEHADGTPIMRRRAMKRIAEINTYVPMRILHKMMASQERLKALQAKAASAGVQGIDVNEQQLMMEWMAQQVLEVWKLTEPTMTLERLQEGLSFQQMMALFNRFFADPLKALNRLKKG